MKLLLASLAIFFFIPFTTVAQSNSFAQKVFVLINQARENPAAFLEKNKVKIKKTEFSVF